MSFMSEKDHGKHIGIQKIVEVKQCSNKIISKHIEVLKKKGLPLCYRVDANTV